MAESKTKPTAVKVEDYIAALDSPRRREEATALVALFGDVSGEPAVMWGPSIIGFGTHRYKYESGREGEICAIGFSPRKANLVFYINKGFPGADELVERLGRLKKSTGCIYANTLADLDLGALRALAEASWANLSASDYAL